MLKSKSEDRSLKKAVRIICAAVFLVAMAVNLPVPMYGQYASQSGSGSFTLAFACYGLGVLPALFFFGGISDRIGRRLPLQAALLLSLLAIAILSVFPYLPALAVSRFAQGLAIGFVGASATACLAEWMQGPMAAERAAGCVTAMLALGYALGGLVTGLSLFSGPTRLPLSFPIHMAAVVLTTLILWLLPNVPMKERSPILRLPFFPPGASLPCCAIGAGWCLVGVVLSAVPVELGRHHLGGWGGISTFLMPMCGLLSQPVARRMAPIAAIRLGLLLSPGAAFILAAGMIANSLPLALTGAALCGVAGVGFSFHGGLAAIAAVSGAERARAAAGFFLASYLGLCGAPLLLGLVAQYRGLDTGFLLLAAVLALASLGLEGSYWLGSQSGRTALAKP